MLCVDMLSVVMLSVIMVNVVAPGKETNTLAYYFTGFKKSFIVHVPGLTLKY
jgi:hypothetical protein